MRKLFFILEIVFFLVFCTFHLSSANVTPRFQDIHVQIYGSDVNGDPTYPWEINSSGWGSVDIKQSVLPDGAATESTLSLINTKLNNNFGSLVGALRVAAQIGNSSGEASFNSGATDAQTLRTASNVYNSDGSTVSLATPLSVQTQIGRQLYRYENVSGTIYEGWNNNHSALDADTTWLVSRRSTSGSVTTLEWALSATFTASWTNRTSYFGAVPFANSYSTILDGSNDYVTIAHNASLSFGRLNAFSFTGWFKTQTPTSAGTLIDKFTGGFGYTLDHDSSGRVRINFQGGGTGNRIRVREDTSVLTGFWNFVCLTYDGSSAASGMKVRVNNSQSGRNVLNDTLTADPTNVTTLSIGASSSGGTPRFQGFVDEVSFWNVELTDAACTELYNKNGKVDLKSNTGNYTQSTSLISWWRMGDSLSYPTIPDQKSSNNGTLLNGVPGSFVKEVP